MEIRWTLYLSNRYYDSFKENEDDLYLEFLAFTKTANFTVTRFFTRKKLV